MIFSWNVLAQMAPFLETGPNTLMYFSIFLDLTFAWSNTFSFFVAVSFLKADHHMAHECSAVAEWLPRCLNVPLHQKAQLFPHTVLYIDHVDFVVMWRACYCYLFLLLLSFFSFHGPYSLRYWCLFLGTLKELIFDSVFTVYRVESLALIFFPPAGCWTWKKLQCWVEFCSPL